MTQQAVLRIRIRKMSLRSDHQMKAHKIVYNNKETMILRRSNGTMLITVMEQLVTNVIIQDRALTNALVMQHTDRTFRIALVGLLAMMTEGVLAN